MISLAVSGWPAERSSAGRQRSRLVKADVTVSDEVA